MKPAAFDYIAPRDVDAALAVLAERGEEAKVLAGGQSLAPMLNLRLAAPAVLLDVNRVEAMAPWRIEPDGALVLGATTRQRAVERSTEIASRWPVLVEAVRCIAHPTIRNRGTIGGSLVHADPSAELPTVALALDAEMVLRSSREARIVCAEEFFITYFTTAAVADELLLEVRIPAVAPRTGTSWAEFAPRQGDYFIVGIASTVLVDADGRIARALIAIGGVGERPVRVKEDALQGLVGLHPVIDAPALQRVVEEAAQRLPMSTGARSSESYKRRLVCHLAMQTVCEAARRAAR